MYPTPAIQGQKQARLRLGIKLERNSYINLGQSYVVPITTLEILKQKGLSTIPMLTLDSLMVVADKLGFMVEVAPRDLWRMWEAASRAQPATPPSNEKTLQHQIETTVEEPSKSPSQQGQVLAPEAHPQPTTPPSAEKKPHYEGEKAQEESRQNSTQQDPLLITQTPPRPTKHFHYALSLYLFYSLRFITRLLF